MCIFAVVLSKISLEIHVNMAGIRDLSGGQNVLKNGVCRSGPVAKNGNCHHLFSLLFLKSRYTPVLAD